ncbi:hypothetical protein PCC7424_2783 [Gloeothece citriformis PCC 7424]|uniref:Prepilin-type N-terminal cleavage/methylation domain-containing protein n=1 Tax=Gloeothece citriformis (strain PCC 7424) TaxID=65393 RepID=B7K8J5_GLOC7|nr:prepilin-type N-terminal cleavage/methylation domain-containing protein [Gloeothece citriformis]ACK71193.1 hypothetical protein PCC7424_2783 [Gloeothece citriformis PCC 7424]
MLRLGKKSLEQGFTLVEVLVAILLTTIFITMTAQLMVINAPSKINKKTDSQSSVWIEQDQEKIIAMANTMASSSTFCTNLLESYAVKLWRQLENEPTSSLPGQNEANGIILEDTGSNYAHPDFVLQKRLSTATPKVYKLQRNYTITTEKADVLMINYAIIDTDTNDKMIERSFAINSSLYARCPKY